jgi:hypothetical protein
MAAFLVMAGTLRAESVTVNLGETAQDILQTGIGDNGSGYAQWYLQQGSSSYAGGVTTDLFSGAYTGSTPGYTGGTYQFLTSYNGNALSDQPIGISSSPGSSYFYFEQPLPLGTTITLDLAETGGPNYVIPIYAGGTFVNGYQILDTSSNCTGVSSCSPFEVGETPGATFYSTVTGSANFNVAATPEPSSIILAGTFGLVGLLLVGRRKLLQSSTGNAAV